MPDNNDNNEHDDQKRAERAHRPPEQTGANVGLLSPGTQSEFDPGFADDTRLAAGGAAPPPPDYPQSLLGDPVLYEHGNEPVRISVFQAAQSSHGNKAVQRHLNSLPVQRDNTGLPPVPSVALTPPSILQPDNPAARYGLGEQYRFRIDPRTEVMMRQYLNLQFDSTLPAVQSAGSTFQPQGPPAGNGQQPPPATGGTGAPPAGGGSGSGAPTPPSPPSGSSGSTGSTPNQPGAGPATPQPASAGQIVSAALASEPFKSAWTNLQTSMTNQAASDWRRLRLGEKIALVSTGASIAIGALAGITLTDDPSARQLLLGQLNGQTLPVPGATWLRVEMNTSGESLMFGLHGDIGALLGPRFGFKPSGATPFGGPPQPQSSYPPPVQRVLQRMPSWQHLGKPNSVGSAATTSVQVSGAPGNTGPSLPVQRDDAPAPEPPKAKSGHYTTKFKINNSTWQVSGTTLSEAIVDITSRDEAGETNWEPNYSVDLDNDGNVSGATVEITINVIMPEWPEAAKLSKKDKKKWKSFMKALKAHEAGHVKLAKAKLAGIAAKMKKKTETEAGEILDTAISELKEASDAYDDKNDHGRKAGTIIEVDEDDEPSADAAPVQPMRMALSSSILPAAPLGDGTSVPVQRDNKAPAAAAPGGTVTFKPVANTTYTVTGKTLKEAAAQIRGREEAGETSWNPVFNEAHDDSGKITTATIDVTITVLLPSWSEASKLTGADKTTWDSFMMALRAHEQHHVDLVKSKLKDVAKNMIGKSKTEADGLLQAALTALKTASDEYDTKTDHGKKEGVKIDTEEEAPPEKDSEESASNIEGTASSTTLSLMRSDAAVPVQRGLLSFLGIGNSSGPNVPTRPMTDPHLQELKTAEGAYFQLEHNYIEFGKEGPDRFIKGVEMQLQRDNSAPDDRTAILNQLRTQKQKLESRRDSFLGTFGGDLNSQVETLLQESTAQIKAEQKRYGIEQVAGKEGAYTMQQNNDTKEMAAAAQELIKLHTEMTNMQIKLQNESRKKHPAAPLDEPQQRQQIDKDVNSNPEYQQAVINYQLMFDKHAGKFPLLAAFRDNPQGMAAAANGGKNPAAAAVIGKELDQKLKDVETTTENLHAGKLKVWTLPNVVAATKKAHHIEKGKVENKFVDERVAEIHSDEAIKNLAIAAIGIAVAIVAAVATAGGSLIVAGVAAGAGVGMSTAALVKDIQEYNVMSAAHNTDLDKAKAISQEDPSLIWVAMDLIALGMDLGAAFSAFKQIAAPIREVLEAQRLARAAAAGAEGAEATSKLAEATQRLKDALKIVPGEVADRVMGKVGGPQKAFLVNPASPLEHAGHAGQSAAKGKGFGVFEAFIPGHREPVVVKIFPEAEAELFKREMKSVQVAADTKIGPKFLGEIDMGKGKKAFAMEKVAGGSVQGVEDEVTWVVKDGKKVGAKFDQSTKAGKEIAETASRINTLTVNDVEIFGRRTIERGYYVRGDLQGLIDANGRWRPIDLQSLRPLQASAEESVEILKGMHNRAINGYIEDLKAMANGPLKPPPAGQLPHVSTPPVQRSVQRARANLYIQRFMHGDRVAGLPVQRDDTPSPATAPAPPKTKNFGEVEAVLKQTPTGLEALALRASLKVAVSMDAGARMGYDPASNSMVLDSNMTPVALALAFTHEMNHARLAKATIPSTERAKTMPQDEFVKAMLKEEAESDIKAYDVKYELQGTDVDFTNSLPPSKVVTEDLYRTTILNKAIEAQIRNNKLTGKELLDIGKAAGREAVIQHFQTGPGHEGHRTHYEKQWKSMNPGK